MADPLREDEKNFSALIDWIHGHGGSVDSRLGLDAFDGVRGVVALDDISQGDLLLRCPWQLVIGTSSIGQTDTPCDIIMALRKELERAECSPWRPYLRVFSGIDGRIPTLWSQNTLYELQGLPPYDATRHTDWFSECCLADRLNKELYTLDKQALVSYVTRSGEVGMIPFYDLLNHHNGKLNTKTNSTKRGVEIVASASIAGGSQVYNSYSTGPTSDLFRDYGFVEPWPRNWKWTDKEMQTHSFMQLPAGIVAIEPTAEFCADLGHAPLPLGEYQQRARSHTRRCSPETLSRFEKAAQEFLDRLPTKASEDARVLEQLCDRSRDNCNTNTNWDSQQKDLIDCVRYRIEFKRAMHSALNAIGAA